MRIVFIAVKGLPIGGGIEKLTEEIGVRLVKRGHQVTVYSSRDYGTYDGNYKGMEIVTVPSINNKFLHKLSICFFATIHTILKHNADIVHFHAVGPSIFSIFPRIVGIPTVVQTHGLEWKRDKWGKIGKFFLKLADYTAVYFPNRITSVSLVQKQYYEKKFGKEVIYIPTGVNNVSLRQPDLLLRQGIKPWKYILFAARLVEEKGAHFLIKAFREIDTDMQLIIAGDAAHSENYKSELKKLADGDKRIKFLGFVTGRYLEELFSSAYIFCLPSTLEGLPIALLEAMSYANCCLASDIPENLEALQGHGFTFKTRDWHSLKKELEALILAPDLVESKKKDARDYVVRNYSWDKIADDIEKLYFSLFKMTKSSNEVQ